MSFTAALILNIYAGKAGAYQSGAPSLLRVSIGRPCPKILK